MHRHIGKTDTNRNSLTHTHPYAHTLIDTHGNKHRRNHTRLYTLVHKAEKQEAGTCSLEASSVSGCSWDASTVDEPSSSTPQQKTSAAGILTSAAAEKSTAVLQGKDPGVDYCCVCLCVRASVCVCVCVCDAGNSSTFGKSGQRTNSCSEQYSILPQDQIMWARHTTPHAHI